jgi:hypothetical protein
MAMGWSMTVVTEWKMKCVRSKSKAAKSNQKKQTWTRIECARLDLGIAILLFEFFAESAYVHRG